MVVIVVGGAGDGGVSTIGILAMEGGAAFLLGVGELVGVPVPGMAVII